ncbi:NTP transferase domain-containing protein [Pedobacter sp. PAMC26386]|nr:NTP transferase domain-containing protein [Pedobacter sp. PAMC26386]
MSRIPKLYGLVLAGGQSTRMGHDKGLINWHGKPQREYMADLLMPFCQKVLISCRADQLEEIEKRNYKGLPDIYPDSGPLGAILSAFTQKENVAWLIVACDLPLIDSQHLAFLCAHRNPAKFATAFAAADGLPEPLLTIWEPAASPVMRASFTAGFSSARQLLIENGIILLKPIRAEALSNVNKQEEAAEIRKII